VLDFRVFLGFFWGLGFFFGFGFLWVIVGFPMYTLCVPKGTLPFFDIYIRIFFFISNVLYIKNPKGVQTNTQGRTPQGRVHNTAYKRATRGPKKNSLKETPKAHKEHPK
jgi:hypothetical protein